MLRDKWRGKWMAANYFVAAAIAMIGWLSLIAWVAWQFLYID